MVNKEQLHDVRSAAGKEWGPDFNENGVHPRTLDFLTEAIQNGVHLDLNVDERNLLVM